MIKNIKDLCNLENLLKMSVKALHLRKYFNIKQNYSF